METRKQVSNVSGSQEDMFFDLLQPGGSTGVAAGKAESNKPPEVQRSAFDYSSVEPNFDFQPMNSSKESMQQNYRDRQEKPSEKSMSSIEATRDYQPPFGAHSQSADQDRKAIISAVEQIVVKHAETLQKFFDDTTMRLQTLENATTKLEGSVFRVHQAVANNHEENDGRIRELANLIREVQRGVQVLRDKQEIAEAQAELSKMKLAAAVVGKPAEPVATQPPVSQSPSAPPPPPSVPNEVAVSAPPAPEAPHPSFLPAVPALPAPPVQQIQQQQPPQQLQLQLQPGPHQPLTQSQQPVQLQQPNQGQVPTAPTQGQVQQWQPQNQGQYVQQQQEHAPYQQQEHTQYLPPAQQQQQEHPQYLPSAQQQQQQQEHPQYLPPVQQQQQPEHTQYLPPVQKQQEQPQYQSPAQQYPPQNLAYPQQPPQQADVPPVYMPSYSSAPPPPPPPQQSHQPGTQSLPPSAVYDSLNYPPRSAEYSSGSGGPQQQASGRSGYPTLPSQGPTGLVYGGSGPTSQGQFRVAQPVPSAPSLGQSGGAYPRLQVAQPVTNPIQTAGGGGAPQLNASRVSVDRVVEDVAAMGFTRDQVRAVVKKLTENGQSADLNVVLDKLMNGEQGGNQKGWFGR